MTPRKRITAEVSILVVILGLLVLGIVFRDRLTVAMQSVMSDPTSDDGGRAYKVLWLKAFTDDPQGTGSIEVGEYFTGDRDKAFEMAATVDVARGHDVVVYEGRWLTDEAGTQTFDQTLYQGMVVDRSGGDR